MDFHPVFGQMKRHIGHVQEVIGEVLLDHVSLVTKADDEIVEAIVTIDLHDVPEDRAAADFHHRFGTDRGFLAKPRAHSTSKDDYFHHKNPGCAGPRQMFTSKSSFSRSSSEKLEDE